MTSKMPSSTTHYKELFLWPDHRASLTPSLFLIFSSFTSLFMDFDNHQEPCILASTIDWDLDFTISTVDHSLFIQIMPLITLLILVYVDELLVTGSYLSQINKIIQTLQTDFLIFALGNLYYFFNVEVTLTSKELLLTQQKHIVNLFNQTNMHIAKPIKTLMTTFKTLSAFSGLVFDDHTLYQSIVGSLNYLSST